MGKNSRKLPKTARQLTVLLWRHLDERCFYCDEKITVHKITADHVFPRSAGYSALKNVVPACRECNERKADIMPNVESIEKVCALYEAAGETFDPRFSHSGKRQKGRSKGNPHHSPEAFWSWYCWQS